MLIPIWKPNNCSSKQGIWFYASNLKSALFYESEWRRTIKTGASKTSTMVCADPWHQPIIYTKGRRRTSLGHLLELTMSVLYKLTSCIGIALYNTLNWGTKGGQTILRKTVMTECVINHYCTQPNKKTGQSGNIEYVTKYTHQQPGKTENKRWLDRHADRQKEMLISKYRMMPRDRITKVWSMDD